MLNAWLQIMVPANSCNRSKTGQLGRCLMCTAKCSPAWPALLPPSPPSRLGPSFWTRSVHWFVSYLVSIQFAGTSVMSEDDTWSVLWCWYCLSGLGWSLLSLHFFRSCLRGIWSSFVVCCLLLLFCVLLFCCLFCYFMAIMVILWLFYG